VSDLINTANPVIDDTAGSIMPGVAQGLADQRFREVAYIEFTTE